MVSQPVEWNCPLTRYTSFSIGGPADAVVTVDRRDELAPLLGFLGRENIPWRIIGKGTNLLVKDSGFAGVILILGKEFRSVPSSFKGHLTGADLVAGGGCSLIRLSSNCIERGLSGLEFAGNIPGTVGGAVITNAGAWGVEISSVVESLTLVSSDGEQVINREDLHFGYRTWHDYREFPGRPVVVEVVFRLDRADPLKIREYSSILRRKRKEKQPGSSATAGSFFKNPPDDSAGRLIEACGFKGVKVGGAEVSEEHANFLVNGGGATSADVLNLMGKIQKKVKKHSGIDLEPEVHFI